MKKQHWQDWLCALVGLWVVVTPWVFPSQDAAVRTSFWVTGGLVVVLAVSELSAFRPWKEWVIALLGAWLFLLPRLMSFESTTLTINAAACGLAIIALSGWAIGDAHEILPRLRRPKEDLRGDEPGISLPDEHEHLAGLPVHRLDTGPELVHPGFDTQAQGQTSHE